MGPFVKTNSNRRIYNCSCSVSITQLSCCKMARAGSVIPEGRSKEGYTQADRLSKLTVSRQRLAAS